MSYIATGISVALTLASAAVTIVGQEKAADAADDAAYNEKLRLDAEAANREMEAAEQIRRKRENDRADLAAVRARLAVSGSETTSGDPLAILGDLAANQDLEIQDAVRAANMQAASLRAGGTMALWEADANRAATTNKQIATGVKAIGSSYSTYSKATA